MRKHRIFWGLIVLCWMLVIASALAGSNNHYGQTASLTMRLSTRTGPSTAYTEPGTFFRDSWQNTSVKVISKAYGNDVWWVQVEFMNNGQLLRAYTGAKRVALDISAIPEETVYGTAQVFASGDVTGYYGPGSHYAAIKEPVPCYASGTIIDAQNGYLLFDFYDVNCDQQRRAWVFDGSMSIDWFSGPPSAAATEHEAQLLSGDLFVEENSLPIWLKLVDYANRGSYSTIDLYFDGSYYPGLAVYMEGTDFGTFSAADGASGWITFLTEKVMLNARHPWENTQYLYVLPKVQ